MEVVKQQVAISKLVQRNYEAAYPETPESTTLDSPQRAGGPDGREQAESGLGGGAWKSNEIKNRLHLPLVFIKSHLKSQIEFEFNEDRSFLSVRADQNCDILTENFLFEAMGLTETSERELRALFTPEINDYMKNQVLIRTEG